MHKPLRHLKAIGRSLRCLPIRICAGWKKRRLARATDSALRELDARTLRDLGFDRSEIPSVAAEVAGKADLPRTLLAPSICGLAHRP